MSAPVTPCAPHDGRCKRAGNEWNREAATAVPELVRRPGKPDACHERQQRCSGEPDRRTRRRATFHGRIVSAALRSRKSTVGERWSTVGEWSIFELARRREARQLFDCCTDGDVDAHAGNDGRACDVAEAER